MPKILLKKLVKALIDHELSQADLAVGVGTHPSAISLYVHGIRKPHPDVVALIESFVGEANLFPELSQSA